MIKAKDNISDLNSKKNERNKKCHSESTSPKKNAKKEIQIFQKTCS